MALFNITVERKKLKQTHVRLNALYQKIPSTVGCLENIKLENGCKGWCCEEQTPQVLYVEFLNSWEYVVSNFSQQQLRELFESCLSKYLYPQRYKGCVFYDKVNRICKQHNTRPYNCRIYGITPDDEFKPRFEKLKVLYPDLKYQCNLIKTENGEEVTKKNIDNWWLELKSIEMAIGVQAKNIHDNVGGTYRTYHDYMLLYILGEEGLEYLTYYRMNGSGEEKDKIIKQTSDNFIKFLQVKINEKHA
jgi:Fe-S-cluster containining protein